MSFSTPNKHTIKIFVQFIPDQSSSAVSLFPALGQSKQYYADGYSAIRIIDKHSIHFFTMQCHFPPFPQI